MHPTAPLTPQSALLSTTAPASPLTPTTLGFYLRTRPHGFAAHVCASPQNLCAVRQLARAEPLAQGIEDDAVDSAQLVLSELVGNSVRAYGDYVPLVVEVYATAYGVAVNVHDPDPGALPRRRATPLGSAEAEAGPGLGLIDLLAPGWHVRRSAIGNRCAVGRRPSRGGSEVRGPEAVRGTYGVVVQQHIANAGVGIGTGVPAGPAEREVAEVLALPGQRVRAWGEWCVIVSVRSEQCGVGDPAVVLGLDEGPELCVQAAEPLVVRQREGVSADIPLVIAP